MVPKPGTYYGLKRVGRTGLRRGLRNQYGHKKIPRGRPRKDAPLPAPVLSAAYNMSKKRKLGEPSLLEQSEKDKNIERILNDAQNQRNQAAEMQSLSGAASPAQPPENLHVD